MYGAVLFDDDMDNGAGWACSSGARPFRFHRASQLQIDEAERSVCWWSNSKAQWTRGLAWLKPHDYLRPTFDGLIAELNHDREDPERTVALLAEVFGRVMQLAADRYGVRADRPALSQMCGLTLSDDVGAVLRSAVPPSGDELCAALQASYQPLVVCVKGRIPGSSTLVTLNLPRLAHARAVLNTPVPVFDQHALPIEAALLPPAGMGYAWACEFQKRPLLLKVRIDSFDASVAPLIALGDRDESGRVWMALPEFAVLGTLAKIDIEDVIVGHRYAGESLADRLITDGPFEALSLSAGVLAANVLDALIGEHSSSPVGGAQASAQPVPDAQSVWLTASDRMLTLSAAMLLHSAGFIVRSYGRGALEVECPEDDLPELCDAASTAGLEMPLFLERIGGRAAPYIA